MPKEFHVDVFVPLTAEQVADRLGRITQRGVLSTSAPLLFARSDLPLAGLVSAKRVALSANGTGLRGPIPVLRAELRSAPGGTRIVGYAGMPRWLVWYLRISFVAVSVYLLAAAAHVLPVLPFWLPLMLVGAVVWCAFVIGWQVHRAEQELPDLIDRFQSAIDVTAPSEAAEPTKGRAAARPRMREHEG